MKKTILFRKLPENCFQPKLFPKMYAQNKTDKVSQKKAKIFLKAEINYLI